MEIDKGYNGNPNLLSAKSIVTLTKEEMDEYIKCAEDPVYFIRNYIKIINLDKGLIKFDMWDFQEDMINTFHNNRFSIVKVGRQSGKSTTVVSYLLHYALFNENVSIAILANKAATSRELLHRLKLSYEHLPNWMKQGILIWNKGDIQFANGSKVIAAATSASAIRGLSINLLYLDEFAIVPNNQAEEFFASTYPTISSGTTSKIIITSTPKGLNHYYRMWMDAVEKRSSYKPIDIHWSKVPGRDEAWKHETIRNTSEQQFRVEFETEFLGSTNTLIEGEKLRTLVFKNPIRKDGDLDIYEEPIEGRTYIITVDVAEGVELDYSAFSVIDVTEIPYKQVAKYRCNNIPPLVYPTYIYNIGKRYNDAFVLVEINSIGLQVADILHFDLDYDNLIKIQIKGKQGQQQTQGFTKKIAFGLKTTKQTKQIGCANLKTLIESDKLIINDADTIMELTTFSSNGSSFEAEEGNTDDLVMTLVHFGWLTSQRYFKENITVDIRKALEQEQNIISDEALVPFGIIDDGLDKEYEKDANGDLWIEDRNKMFPFDDLNYHWKHRL